MKKDYPGAKYQDWKHIAASLMQPWMLSVMAEYRSRFGLGDNWGGPWSPPLRPSWRLSRLGRRHYLPNDALAGNILSATTRCARSVFGARRTGSGEGRQQYRDLFSYPVAVLKWKLEHREEMKESNE